MKRRRLGVLGTFVWDVIYGRDARRGPVEEWGGIAYALAALDAALPEDWEIVPIIKVGSDLADRAREYIGTLRRLAPDGALVEVPYPNNRVELRYVSAERRTERLTGGVPGWTSLGLSPLLRDIDALYVNFISGNELDLEATRLLRQRFTGPIYGDLHSLTLGVASDGVRTALPLSNVAEWTRCFDFVQVNEDELALMTSDPLALAAAAIANGVRCLLVTLGARGVVYFTAPGFERLRDARESRVDAPIRTARVPAPSVVSDELADPTGCGDVFGATYFSRMLAGDTFADALQSAQSAAARNVAHRGASGLARFLRGELSIP